MRLKGHKLIHGKDGSRDRCECGATYPLIPRIQYAEKLSRWHIEHKEQVERGESTREHQCPWCFAKREAPITVLAHPRSIYTVKCECGKKYKYMYDCQDAWKDTKK